MLVCEIGYFCAAHAYKIAQIHCYLKKKINNSFVFNVHEFCTFVNFSIIFFPTVMTSKHNNVSEIILEYCIEQLNL